MRVDDFLDRDLGMEEEQEQKVDTGTVRSGWVC